MVRALVALAGLVLPVLGFYNARDQVVELTQGNFEQQVTGSDAVWMVEFYAPWCGHCKSLTPEYKKLAAATQGVIKVGAVDADKHKSLGSKYGVQGFPTLKIFGLDKSKPSDYQGERTAKGMVDAVMREAKSVVSSRLSGGGSGSDKTKKKKNKGSSDGKGKVIELTDDNFDELVTNSEDSYMVAFTAPWCGHCKSLKPAWAEAAAKLGGKVKLANVDATVHTGLGQRFQVQGYPTIKVFSGAGASRRDGVPYQGGRNTEDIVSFALSMAPPPKVTELIDPKDFDVCKTEMCIVTFVPSLYDGGAKARNDIVKSLKQQARKSAGQELNWFWAAPGAQKNLQEALMRGSTVFPAVYALNSAKQMAASMKSGFDDKNLGLFIVGLSTGKKTQTQQLPNLPAVVKADKWDGKDAAPVDVDEISLDELFGDDDNDEL